MMLNGESLAKVTAVYPFVWGVGEAKIYLLLKSPIQHYEIFVSVLPSVNGESLAMGTALLWYGLQV